MAGMMTLKPLVWVLVWVWVVKGDSGSRGDINLPPTPGLLAGEQCQSVAVSNLLQSFGYSASCVASTLALCSQLKDETMFASHMEDMRAVIHEMRPSERKCNGRDVVEANLWGPRNCYDLKVMGDSGRGLRQIHPYPDQPNETATVYCDHTVDDGGWLVFQRRTNTTVRENFERTWTEYEEGFGDMEEEFWMGLELLHVVTLLPVELRVDLADYEGNTRWAKYRVFKVGPTQDHYRLKVGQYTGSAGDVMKVYNGMQFTTRDGDHDDSSSNCAISYKGGWWFKACHAGYLNGYPHAGRVSTADGITWGEWLGNNYSLKNTTLMIRPVYS